MYRLSRLKPRASEKEGSLGEMRGLITNIEDLFFGLHQLLVEKVVVCGHEDLCCGIHRFLEKLAQGLSLSKSGPDCSYFA